MENINTENLDSKSGWKVLTSQLAWKYRRQRTYLKHWGLLKFCKHVLVDSFHYEKYCVFEGDLSGPVPEESAKIPVNVRLLVQSDEDIDRLVEFWPDMYAPAINTPDNIRKLIWDRLSAGEKCLIAEFGGKIAHMNWIGFKNAHLFVPFSRKRGIGDAEALSYNTYCAPEYRGNRLQYLAIIKKFEILKNRGFTKIISYTQPNNYASINNLTKVLGKPVQTLRCLNILGYDFYHLTKKKDLGFNSGITIIYGSLNLKSGWRELASLFTQKLLRQLTYYRQWGILKFCKHILVDSAYCEKYAVFERDLSEPFQGEQAKIPVNVRLLNNDDYDIDRLVKFWPEIYAPPLGTLNSIRKMIMDRLSAGEECIIAEYEGKIIYMTWHGFKNTHLFNPYVRKRRIGTDEAIGYNSYCDADYRGNNLQSVALIKKLEILRSKGYKKLVGYTQPNNYASMKNMTKIFGKPVKTQYSITIFGFSYYFQTNRAV